MSHVYTALYFHCVFSTKNREPVLDRQLRSSLFPYLYRVAEQQGFQALSVGGVEDHVHAVLSLASTISVARALQLIKGNSSRWINQSFDLEGPFAWQRGYAAFSIGYSQIPATKCYIAEQERHHSEITFEKELRAFFRKHNLPFDPQSLSRDGTTIAHPFKGGS